MSEFEELIRKSIKLPPEEVLKEMEENFDHYLETFSPEFINWVFTRIVYLCQITGNEEKERFYISQFMNRNIDTYKVCKCFENRLAIMDGEKPDTSNKA